MKLSVSSLVIFACLSLNLLAQSSFQISSMDEIVDFDGPYYYTISHQGDQFSFKEFDVDNHEQSESVLDVSGFEGSSDVKFHSMTRYGDSDNFLVVLRRWLVNGNTIWDADSIENHYFRFNRNTESFDLHVIDTTFGHDMKIQSNADNEVFKINLSGFNGASDGTNQSGELIAVSDQLIFTQLAPPDSIVEPNGNIGTYRINNDSLFFFLTYNSNIYLQKYSSQGHYIGGNYVDVSNGISYTHFFGLKYFQDSIFTVLNGTVGDFNSGYQEVFRLFSTNYDLDEVYHDIQLYQSGAFEMHDGQIDYVNKHVVVLAKSIIDLITVPMEVLIFDFQGNLICQSQIPYHHLNTEVGLESLNGIVYLKHAVNDSIDQWEPFTCGILNAESNSEIPMDELIIYPNPTSDVLQVQSTFSGNFQINDLQGRMVYEQKANSGVTSIDVSKLKGGNYIIKFFGEGKVIQKKFIKL